MSDRKIGLTIFLLKDKKLGAFEDELVAPLRELAIPVAEPLDGFFIPLPAANDAAPVWVASVGSLLAQPIGTDMEAKVPRGLLVLRHSGRTFAL